MGFHYEVPGVQLIRQDKHMACWFASAMMLLNWKERYRPGSAINLSRVIDSQTMKMHDADKGIKNPQIVPLALRLGLHRIPPQSPTIEGLLGWLRRYGPLWTNGKQHIVVIAGIKQNTGDDYSVKVYDPWNWPPVPVQWRSLSGWYAGFDAKKQDNATRDTGTDVEAVFLHV